MIPLVPFWGFFNVLRDRSPVPLAIEQYFAFLRAIHKMDISFLKTAEDLMHFTQIFWLCDPLFARQYALHFRQFYDWDKYIKELPSKKTLETQRDPTTLTQPAVQKPQEPAPEKPGKEDRTAPGDGPNPPQQARETVDFELVLQDTSRSAPAMPDVRPLIAHSYALSEKTMIPFDPRTFIQALRRKVETTEQVQSESLDLGAMVERYTTMGFLDEIVYEIEDSSYSNVVLLADRFGSMLAYEHLETHLGASLRQIPYCAFAHYFFYNLPDATEDSEHYLLRTADEASGVFHTRSHQWTRKTWFLILSDAGAHSGMVNRDRIQATLKFWRYLQGISPYTFWLNPVPFEYLNDCTAKRLQMRIPMITTDHTGLSHMIAHAKPSR